MNQERLSYQRKPWIAALMSLALPGWGQLYNGQANRAIWCFLIFALLALPVSALFATVMPPGFMLPALIIGLLVSLGLWLYCSFDAYREARRQVAFSPRAWQTSGLYVLAFITCALLILPSLTIAIRAHLVQPFHIPSASMSPNLLPGDLVFANMAYNCYGCQSVKRGDVAIFTYPNNRSWYYVKRVIALPGDRIRMDSGKLVVNDVALASESDSDLATEQSGNKSWQVQGASAHTESFDETVVAPGHAFVLGDNRSASNDSRQFGAVPLADIVGRVRQVWFSRADGKVRWDRIGKLVR